MSWDLYFKTWIPCTVPACKSRVTGNWCSPLTSLRLSMSRIEMHSQYAAWTKSKMKVIWRPDVETRGGNQKWKRKIWMTRTKGQKLRIVPNIHLATNKEKSRARGSRPFLLNFLLPSHQRKIILVHVGNCQMQEKFKIALLRRQRL